MLLVAAPVSAQAITGAARVIDGDTLAIGATHFRLFGIDAPEHDQTCADGGGQVYACGTAATVALRAMIGAQPVTCEARDTDRYGRTIAVCSTPGTEDLGEQLVSRGLAVAYLHFSTLYLPDEQVARAAGLGLWGGRFAWPWKWRRNHFVPMDATSVP